MINELDFIDKILKPIAGKNSLGLTDDCAVFGEFVITKDVLSSGTHFFAGDAPFNLARKALRVNLSDLAAMGAEPFGFLLGLSLPKNFFSPAGGGEKWLADFAAGLKSDIKKYKIQLLGGDTITHDAPLHISITAIGKTRKPLRRSGARAGDNIFVSGKIGESYLGLKLKTSSLRGGKSDEAIQARLLRSARNDKFIEKYELPEPQIALGKKLRGVATSCIDISDGLLLDLSRICKASGVGAEIFSKDIPIPVIPVQAGILAKPTDVSGVTLYDLITAGDDYQLLFTAAREKIKGCHKIGKITATKTLKLDGEKVQPKGYVH